MLGSNVIDVDMKLQLKALESARDLVYDRFTQSGKALARLDEAHKLVKFNCDKDLDFLMSEFDRLASIGPADAFHAESKTLCRGRELNDALTQSEMRLSRGRNAHRMARDAAEAARFAVGQFLKAHPELS